MEKHLVTNTLLVMDFLWDFLKHLRWETYQGERKKKKEEAQDAILHAHIHVREQYYIISTDRARSIINSLPAKP